MRVRFNPHGFMKATIVEIDTCDPLGHSFCPVGRDLARRLTKMPLPGHPQLEVADLRDVSQVWAKFRRFPYGLQSLRRTLLSVMDPLLRGQPKGTTKTWSFFK